VGSLIRTADGVGVEEVILSGYTPGPYDKFKRLNKELAKTSLRAHETVPIRRIDSLLEELSRFNKEGWYTIAAESGEKGIPYTTIPSRGAYVCVVGNEVDGIDKETLSSVGVIAEIPMKGKKESLNVATAGAVLLFHLRDGVHLPSAGA
jgi:tRNA G18 (ribose-2'-O)-methylase SpoU